MSFDLKYVFCTCECSCMLHPLESVEVKSELCISGWSGMCQPYIASTTTLSDIGVTGIVLIQKFTGIGPPN